MRKLIMIKSAPEIFLKGLNRNKFEKKLKDNIKRVLRGTEYELVVDQGRWFLSGENIDDIITKVRRVFGVSEVCVVSEVETSLDGIGEEALNQLKTNGSKSFKIETKRADKRFPLNSMEVSKKIGGHILRNYEEVHVDVNNPDCRINVEIREGGSYVYSKRIKGVGGMPYGTNGRTLLMLSGGIDSPVAGYMMARRGAELSCVYYHSHPYTSERAKEKVIELARILKGFTGRVVLYVVPFTEIQMQIIEKCHEEELTILMRIFMMRIACELAKKYDIHSVTTGESIGQVASQTMESLVVSNYPADRPVFRPLIAMDKIDIMDIAREIGTYETSILPYEDCCTIFVPKHPKTKPVLERIKLSESILKGEELIEEAINNMEVIEV
jgi:tRNA uracil 4-sulfurtransferase